MDVISVSQTIDKVEEILEYEQEVDAEHNRNEEKKEEDFEVEKEYSSYGQKGRYIVPIMNSIIHQCQ